MKNHIEEFRETVYAYYHEHGRKELPWRVDTRPWGVLVSEYMLQQTQIDRVIPYWRRWMERWPKPEDLSGVPLEEALRAWAGLGYNRRGRALWDCARRIVSEFGGAVPDTPRALLALPGIGAYSAGAIACFAYNKPSVFIETNIRAAVISFFFPNTGQITDTQIAALLDKALDRENPRLWYWALMDFGARVKKNTGNPNRRSAHYTRQSPFEGSFRQRRGRVLRILLDGPASAGALLENAGMPADEFFRVIASLEKDGLVTRGNGVWQAGQRPPL